MSVNKIILIGKLGQDPEIINFDNGGQIAKFTLATTETYKNKQGEKVSNTTWHNVQATGNIVKVIESYVKKGDQLYIEGSYKNKSYETKSGEKKIAYYVDLKELKMLGGKKEQAQQGGNNYNEFAPGEDEGDDLPF